MKDKIEFFYVKKGRGKILQAKGTARGLATTRAYIVEGRDVKANGTKLSITYS